MYSRNDKTSSAEAAHRMEKRNLDALGEQQLAIMNALWERGPSSVHDVRAALGNKKLAYTTVLSTLQKLEKAGWVTHETQGRVYLYRPTCTRAAAGGNSLKAMIARLFRGDPLLLLENLIDETALSAKDLTRLRKMIDDRRKEPRHD